MRHRLPIDIVRDILDMQDIPAEHYSIPRGTALWLELRDSLNYYNPKD